MEALRRAAELSLSEFGEEPPDAAGVEPRIERMVVDVHSGDGTELVSLHLRDGRMRTTCSCGERGCAHVRIALRMLAEQPASDSTRRSSTRLERVLPELAQGDDKTGRAQADLAALSEALDDVVTAVVRAGVASERVPSVVETISRVEQAAGSPPPLGVRRWIGRLRHALDTHDVALAAHALVAASTLAVDLRSTDAGPSERERLATWLGPRPGDALARICDRNLLEVAREWVAGTERVQLERRYLVDLNSGEVFREELARRERPGSVGSCPRLIGVALAEAEPSCAPRRLRLLQYTTTPAVDRASWDLLAAWGQRDSEALSAAYHSAQQAFGALAEPFVLVAPRGFEPAADPKLLLDRGAPLPLFDDDEPGVLQRFEAQLATGALAWVAGRLCDTDGRLMLKPLAAAILTEDGIRHERL